MSKLSESLFIRGYACSMYLVIYLLQIKQFAFESYVKSKPDKDTRERFIYTEIFPSHSFPQTSVQAERDLKRPLSENRNSLPCNNYANAPQCYFYFIFIPLIAAVSLPFKTPTVE
ncbi:hypothetical protein F4782DRAFT_176416 [Xylaria castorea]|nr:hypothetical protein F4782DRAFT_176416 [Xylaria castorea]